MRVPPLLSCMFVLLIPGLSLAQTKFLPVQEDLRIGVVAGPDYLQFHQVGGAALRPDGTIVVLDNGSTEVRLFSKSGDFVRRFGRRGDGPGEFRPPAWMCTGGEYVVIMDQNARATFFRMDGTPEEEVPLYGPGRPSINLIGKSPRGWLATVRQPGSSARLWTQAKRGRIRYPST